MPKSRNIVDRANYPPLVYHYAGTIIPDYAVVTLRNVVSFWPSQVFLLHSSAHPPIIKGVITEDFRSWYSANQFEEVLLKSPMDGEFREGFWLHALERFFVLSQWMVRTGCHRLLHAELDVRLFDHGDMFERLDAIGAGVFMPRASIQQAGANWLYCNEPEALKLIVNEFCRRADEGFEMQLLARFMDDFPSTVRAVPSHSSVESPDPSEVEYAAISLQEIGRIVDVHPLGTWMLGQDRRNIPNQPVFNHFFYDELGSEKLRNVRYHYSWVHRRLEVRHSRGSSYPVAALHVHSKIMRRAYSAVYLALYSWLANRSFDSLVIPQRLGPYIASIGRSARNQVYLFLRRLLNYRH